MSAAKAIGRAEAPRREAATWRMRIEETPELAHSTEFLTWLEDPQNREAFAQVSATWDAFDHHLASPGLIAIRRDALKRARRASLRPFLPARRRLGAMAAALVLSVAGGVAGWQMWFAPTEYSTGIGERRAITLEDGSRISLDSDTAVAVRYSEEERSLELERGRARFDVKHDIARPFTVTAGRETVVAVGTSFDVERLGQKVLVTLIEGRVVVQSAQGLVSSLSAPPTKPVALAAGQQLVAARDVAPAVKKADLPIATAWEAGRLILNNETLAEAVERVNRYTNKPLRVDPEVAGLRVSGVFNAGDVSSFVEAITSYFPVQAGVSWDNRIVLEKRS